MKIENMIDVIDWSTVPVDTLLFVRDYLGCEWQIRHFCKYENGTVYAFPNGDTSGECGHIPGVPWAQAALVPMAPCKTLHDYHTEELEAELENRKSLRMAAIEIAKQEVADALNKLSNLGVGLVSNGAWAIKQDGTIVFDGSTGTLRLDTVERSVK